MGIGGVNIWQLLILLLVIILVFGTNKLRSIGADLGSAIKGFRNAMRDSDDNEINTKNTKFDSESNRVIDGQIDSKTPPKT